ncbi:MAG: acyltransferase domain-containing protein [Desulfobacter sp.]|nr:MAG: acyltransferase domain-containing protein [Desulfobacter sp.]
MARSGYRHIFLFTGQGAQYPGMAAGIYRTEPVFRQWMDFLAAAAGERMPLSMTGFLFGGGVPENSRFDNILISHPVLFSVQFALAKTLIHYGIEPDCLLGTSLGEFVALALAEVAPPEDMLAMLLEQAAILETVCPAGAMTGISDRPERYQDDPVIRENVWLAGISAPRHFLVSGKRAGMARVIRRLEDTGTGYQELPVRFPFHSPGVEPALDRWMEESLPAAKIRLAVPETPVISCCTGRLVKAVSPSYLTDIGRRPVIFPEALKTLNHQLGGAPGQEKRPVKIFDLGPGAWTSGFVRQNKILARPMNVYRVMTLLGDEIKHMDKIKREVL